MKITLFRNIKFTKWNKIIRIIILFILILMFIALTYIVLTSKNTFIQSIGLGILSSIIASFLFIIISQTVQINNEDSISNEISKLKSIIENKIPEEFTKVNASIEQLVIERKFNNEGIISVSTKEFEQPNYWISLLKDCNDSLSLMGHSLDAWFRDPYKSIFYDTLRKLANNDKLVRIVMFLPLTNATCKFAKEQLKYKEGVIKSIERIYENVIETIDEEKKKNIIIKLAPYCSIHNMIFRTDHFLCISPYNRYSPNHKNILFQLIIDSPISFSFINDYEEIYKSNHSYNFLASNKSEVRNIIDNLTKIKKTYGRQKRK